MVAAFTNGILMAVVAAIFGEPNFDAIILDLGDGQVLVGSFLTAVVNFLLIAAALFLVLKMAMRVTSLKKEAEPVEDAPVPSDEVVLLTEIRDLLRARRTTQATQAT